MNGRKHGQRRKRGQIGIVGGKAALGEKNEIFFSCEMKAKALRIKANHK
jgi:hypothetical protein